LCLTAEPLKPTQGERTPSGETHLRGQGWKGGEEQWPAVQERGQVGAGSSGWDVGGALGNLGKQRSGSGGSCLHWRMEDRRNTPESQQLGYTPIPACLDTFFPALSPLQSRMSVSLTFQLLRALPSRHVLCVWPSGHLFPYRAINIQKNIWHKVHIKKWRRG
jgi:hypothetical protein